MATPEDLKGDGSWSASTSPSEDPGDQLRYLVLDMRRSIAGRWWRVVSVPFSAGHLSVIGYRLSRCAYLALGRRWSVAHTLLAPVRVLTRPFGARLEIHYKASVGPGLLVLHPTLGVVISGHATVGSNVTLTGGNCLGGRAGMAEGGGLVVGNDVTFGANAVALGPLTIGDDVQIGAGAVVIHDAAPGAVLVGVPARPVRP